MIKCLLQLEKDTLAKYKDILLEQSELDKIIRLIWVDLVQQQQALQKEGDLKKAENPWNDIMYEQFNYRELNKTLIIPVKKSDCSVTKLYEKSLNLDVKSRHKLSSQMDISIQDTQIENETMAHTRVQTPSAYMQQLASPKRKI